MARPAGGRRPIRGVTGLLRTLSCVAALMSVPTMATDETARLDRAISSAESRIEDLLLRFTERHPDVVIARSKLDKLRADRTALPAPSVKQPAGVTTAATPGPSAAASARQPAAAAGTVYRPPTGALHDGRRVETLESFAALCRTPGVLACFDFEGDTPLASRIGAYRGELGVSGGGRERARLYDGAEAAGGHAVRMDFLPEDGADHGVFVFTVDEFTEGDRLTVQWRQWFSPELITTFDKDNRPIVPRLGGGGAKQIGITEIGDPRGCSFGEIVAVNSYWSGGVSLYHGCGLWFSPREMAPLGKRDPSDFDLQPGGDNVCRYRYMVHPGLPDIDYLAPTTPANLRDVPSYSGEVDPRLYHGCIGWVGERWMTFRIEIDIAYCREHWGGGGIPPKCRQSGGRVRYWVKYPEEEQPWLVIDYPMPLRWKPGHSGRYGRFLFMPYNTGETAMVDKPPAYTLYDDILVARNADDLPWVKE